jgi:dihydroorotate dehydrogenase electron transfer subunit
MTQYQEKAIITRVERLSTQTLRLTMRSTLIAGAARPGQFIMIRPSERHDPLLGRPFSIHQTTGSGTLQIYFNVVGRGTAILASARVDDELDLLGPLGKGYRLVKEAPACLIGGGLGIAPLLFLAKERGRGGHHTADDRIILGGRSRADVEPLVEDFTQFGLSLHCITEDGTFGEKGLATDLLITHPLSTDTVIYGCGPQPMLAALYGICVKSGNPCQVSVESVMACGMGACLGCTVMGHDDNYVHVCVDGPVFDARDLQWQL